MDAFFASVEQVANPALAGKPVLVAGSVGRGILLAASYAARAYGVETGMPLGKAQRLCPQAEVVRADVDKYVDASRRLFRIMSEFSPQVEPYSIDEMFLDLAGTPREVDPLGTGMALKRRVREELGLPCSVGIGPNRFLAKMATGFDKPDGLFLLRMEDVPARLHPLPVQELWGIGSRLTDALDHLGIRTAGQLAAFPVESLRARFGVVGETLASLAREEDATEVGGRDGVPNRSMSSCHTLPRDTRSLRVIRRTLLALCDKLTRRLRAEGYAARTVVLTVRQADFETVTRHRTLPDPVDDDLAVYRTAWSIWEGLGVREAIRLLGVGVMNLLHPVRHLQGRLGDSPRGRAALAAVDRIRDLFGEGSIVRAPLVGAYDPMKAVHFQTTRDFARGASVPTDAG